MALMITRCPACGTRFKVVPDQLRMSQGWVRCGHCAEIFDAARQMAEAQVEGSALPSTPVFASADALAAGDASPWPLQASAHVPEADPTPSDDRRPDEPAQPQASAGAPADAGGRPGLDRASADPSADGSASAAPPPRLVVAIAAETASASLRVATPDADAIPLPRRPAVQAPPSAPAAPRVVAAAPARAPVPLDPAHAELSFLRDVVQAPPPQPVSGAGRTARLLWAAGAALALLVLLWQFAVHERDRLATSAPGLRPLLGALCAPLDCLVQPVRRIDAIVIDGSSFQALGERGYRLSLTLRNRASHTVALPAVALSLTDIAEQPVVRRVLLPQDFGTPPDALGAHGEWNGSVDLQIAENAGAARVVGYRIDPFYP